MKLAVVGSRDFDDYARLVDVLDSMRPDFIVSGGAKGADSLAVDYAKFRGIPYKEWLPDYPKYGPKLAPLERNKVIASQCDEMVAFWNMKSTGTKHVMDCARRLGKPVHLVPTCRIRALGGT